MSIEPIEFKVTYQQKIAEVKTLPLLPGHTTVINTAKFSGGCSLTLECLINTLKTESNKNFLYHNTEAPIILARAFLAKFGGGVDVYNEPEKLWDANILSFIMDNNLYFPTNLSCIPLTGLIGNYERNGSEPVIDYYFLNNIQPADLFELQRTNPNAVFVINEVIQEGREIIKFSSYCHSE